MGIYLMSLLSTLLYLGQWHQAMRPLEMYLAPVDSHQFLKLQILQVSMFH